MKRTYSDDELTDWEYSTSSTGSNKIERYTVNAVTALLEEIISSRGISATAADTFAGSVVNQIVSEEIPVIYYYHEVYYRYLIDSDPPLPRAERTVTTFYSGRNNQIGETIEYENYD